MTNQEGVSGPEALIVPGEYRETLPLDIEQIATSATLGLFGGRTGGHWFLRIRDFTGISGLPEDEDLPPILGEVYSEADPFPLDSTNSFVYAHGIARAWLIARGLQVGHETRGAQLRGCIVNSRYEISKPSSFHSPSAPWKRLIARILRQSS